MVEIKVSKKSAMDLKVPLYPLSNKMVKNGGGVEANYGVYI